MSTPPGRFPGRGSSSASHRRRSSLFSWILDICFFNRCHGVRDGVFLKSIWRMPLLPRCQWDVSCHYSLAVPYLLEFGAGTSAGGDLESQTSPSGFDLSRMHQVLREGGCASKKCFHRFCCRGYLPLPLPNQLLLAMILFVARI